MSKKQIQPTGREMVMDAGEIIVSKTDLKGRITYGNTTFMKYAGFEEIDLIGTQHNIVRHPDMPRGIFKLFWDTLQQGQEIFAFVKNISRDGSFYWVFANVTPSVDQAGNILGYYSVRRKPNPRAIEAISTLYRDMLSAEQRVGAKDAIAASTRVLDAFLQSQGQSYEQAILSLQAMPSR